MSDRWDFYFSLREGLPISAFVDLGIRDEVPHANQPLLILFLIKMNNPRPNGLSSREEFDRLVEIEEALELAFQERLGATYVGRLTKGGRRELYFYAPESSSVEGVAFETMNGFPEYQYQWSLRKGR
jgi:hypothetical protein